MIYEKQTDDVRSPTGDATSHTLPVLRALSIFGPAFNCAPHDDV